MKNNVKKVVIAGGGTAGWMAAALLSKTMGKTIETVLIESDEIPTVGVGEATIPPLLTFHNILGIDEREFMAEVNGTFKLGISFQNWRKKDHEYLHSFGYAGKDCWACSFIHFWLAGKNRGIDYPYGDYCAEILAAREDKFAVLPKGGMNYAYHMDAGRYAAYLRRLSEGWGASRQEGKITQVNLNSETGDIASLSLASGEQVTGDFFIDCTGFRALLIEGALNTGFEDWSHWLPCDRAMAVQTESLDEPIPYTRSIAHDAGWQWRIPLQTRVGNGLVYSSKYLEDDAAAELLRSNIAGSTLNDIKPIRFRTGTRRKHWNKNCLALGLASGFLEPLESTSIHMIQRSLIRFMQLFPSNGVQQSDVDEFNAQNKIEVERTRDFIILHYKVTEREDTAFWRYCKNMDVPAALKQKISLFRDSGKVFKVDNELFGEESWMQVMMGQGIMPASYHPIADVMSDKELEDFLSSLRKGMRANVDKLPSHQKFLDFYCKTKG
ncbi:tryptophan halogenase family protein [Gilvimarinus agarilyticus]|uniref:tryptophan halogenase family protein n=1 Tax=Gilvimarinus agarilyticus TaxID=679259 RepID=UPI0005A00E38|nr:tryptophan halogenase family protein [Gilvimarinus agarilyticus]